MKVCVLDGWEIGDRETLHDVLGAALGLPEWYGRNLDALYDCLTEASEEIRFRILHEDALRERLGDYAKSLEKVICVAAENNPRIKREL